MSTAVAQDLPSVSPSRVRALRECFLRVAFAQASPAPGKKSDAQLIGDAAHATLAELLEPGEPFDERLATVGPDFLATLERLSGARPIRRARPAAARLRNVGARAVSLVVEAGERVQIRCEQRLTSHDRQLNGIVDLTVASPTLHAIVDYKTGAVFDEEGALADHLQDQLALYCVLEHERSGNWPDRALILRFGGAPVEWAVDEEACRRAAREALTLRETYLEYIGASPPASPSPRTCRHCAFAPRCDSFWDAIAPEWIDHLVAVRGTVIWAERSSAGGTTIRLKDVEGARSGEVVVQQLPEDVGLEDLADGSRVALVGLWVDRENQLNAGRTTRSWIWA